MSLWNWKRSGWVNLSLTILLIISVITSISSSGIRSGFKEFAPSFRFHERVHPEVGFFNFLLFFAAIFGFVSVALRYSYIKDQIQVMPTSINYINKISVSVGALSFLGLVITAAFSSSLIEKASSFQSAGAYIFIGVGVIFTLLQTVLTYTSTRYSLIFTIRLFLAITLLCTFSSSIVFAERNKVEDSSFANKSEISSNDIFFEFSGMSETEITVSQKGILLIACILEWISVVVYALFYLSFFQEFQTISAYVIMRPFITSSTNDFRSSSLTISERV